MSASSAEEDYEAETEQAPQSNDEMSLPVITHKSVEGRTLSDSDSNETFSHEDPEASSVTTETSEQLDLRDTTTEIPQSTRTAVEKYHEDSLSDDYSYQA